MKIVSLVPSITETLRAWGVDPIACTRYCEQPDLATVGGVKNPDIGAIVALAPDVVAMDRQENRRADADALAAAGIELVVLDVVGLDGLDAELQRLADAVGVSASTPTIEAAGGTTDVTGDVTTDVAGDRRGQPGAEPGERSSRRRAFVPIWRRPWMTIGGATYGSSLLAAIGFDNVFAGHPDDYPTVDLTAVTAGSPDVVIVPSEPYEFSDDHVAELAEVVPDARIVRVDGQDLFWWGARTPTALARLSAQLNAAHDRQPGR